MQQRCFFHRSRSLISCSSRFLSNLVPGSCSSEKKVGCPTPHHQLKSKDASEGQSLVNRIILKICLYLQDPVHMLILDGELFYLMKGLWTNLLTSRWWQFTLSLAEWSLMGVNGKWLVSITYPYDMSCVSCTPKFNQGKQQDIIGWSFQLLNQYQWGQLRCPMIYSTMLYPPYLSSIQAICHAFVSQQMHHTICMSRSQNAKWLIGG